MTLLSLTLTDVPRVEYIADIVEERTADTELHNLFFYKALEVSSSESIPVWDIGDYNI